MHMQRKRTGLGDAASGTASIWDSIGEALGTGVNAITQYQLNKQAIKAGNISATNYVTPAAAGGGAVASAMPSKTVMIVAGLGLVGLYFAMRRR